VILYSLGCVVCEYLRFSLTKGPLDKPFTIPERKNLDSATIINLSNTSNSYVTITESKNLVSTTNRLLPFPQTTVCPPVNHSFAFTNHYGASTNLSPFTNPLPLQILSLYKPHLSQYLYSTRVFFPLQPPFLLNNFPQYPSHGEKHLPSSSSPGLSSF
jgi:hypothetical protein